MGLQSLVAQEAEEKTAEGISVKEAKSPPGKHRVRISLADKTGAVTVREIAFEVL